MGSCVKVHFVKLEFYPIIPPPYGSDQGGSQNLFEKENRYSNVTNLFDDIHFSAHKGPSNPKHNE